MKVWVPEEREWLPKWGRISFGSFALITGVLMFVLDFRRFGWISQLCLGFWFLLCYPVPRRAESNARDYLTRPRVLASFVLLFGVIAGSFRSLWLASFK